MIYKREVPLIWRSTLENNNNLTVPQIINCRNSIQGKTLIVDDEGYVCSRSNLAKTGCCNLNTFTADAQQYSCHTCNDETGCCAAYEYCVSCCLSPERV